MFLITIFIENRSLSTVHKNGSALTPYFNHIQDVMINSDTVIVNGTEKEEKHKMDDMTINAYDRQIKNDLINSNSTYCLRNIGIIFTVTMLSYAIYLHNDNKMESSKLASIGLMLMTFLQFYESIVGKFRMIMNDIEKMNEVQEYFSQFKIYDEQKKNDFKIKNGNIVLKNVTINYTKDNVEYNVLNNFNLSLDGNQIIAFVGKIGSGKTSVVKSIAGLNKYGGNIFIDGQNIQQFNYDNVMNHIAYIPQHPKLFYGSVYYNIAYGTKFTKQEIWTKLKSLGVTKIFTDKNMPHGLDTNVGKEGSLVSGGQRQIIAIVRAIIQNKKIMLLDEPTSSLDSANKQIVVNLLKQQKNKTLIIVTHDAEIMNIFHKVIDFSKK